MTSNDTARLTEMLAKEAYREGAVGLSSGAQSTFYIDGKQVTYRPDGAALVGALVWDKIATAQVAAVGGLTLGSDAIVLATILHARQAGTEVVGFSVRKDHKAHGMRKLIEGIVPEAGSRVAVVDDVVTSGSSLVRAIKAAREAGLEVVRAVPIVDREQGAREAVTAENVEFDPLCTAAQVRDAFQRMAVGTSE